tara:strand:+ start:1091 stop:1303 length:213 start_codon:yes stop_codon:yes gene_type:complete
MSKIQEKIKIIMNDIQSLMESHPRAHLEEDTKIHTMMDKASIYFSHMSDEDRDYYQSIQYALEEEMEWKL